MERDWVEFALKLAEGARAKVAEDRKQLELIRKLQSEENEKQLVATPQS